MHSEISRVAWVSKLTGKNGKQQLTVCKRRQQTTTLC